MVSKWFKSYLGGKSDAPIEASNNNSDERNRALEDLAMIYESREDWSKAAETWEKVCQDDPERIRALLGNAQALTKLGQADQAQAVYQSVADYTVEESIELQNAPHDDKIRKQAKWFYKRQRWRESLDGWIDILKRFPGSMEAALSIAKGLVELGETSEARNVLADLVQNFPNRAGPWQNLLTIGLHERNWPMCELAYDKCVGTSDIDLKVLKECLRYRIERRQFDLAQQLVEAEFKKLDPIEAAIGRVRIEIARPDLMRCLELIEEGEAQFPTRVRRFRNIKSDCYSRVRKI